MGFKESSTNEDHMKRQETQKDSISKSTRCSRHKRQIRSRIDRPSLRSSRRRRKEPDEIATPRWTVDTAAIYLTVCSAFVVYCLCVRSRQRHVNHIDSGLKGFLHVSLLGKLSSNDVTVLRFPFPSEALAEGVDRHRIRNRIRSKVCSRPRPSRTRRMQPSSSRSRGGEQRNFGRACFPSNLSIPSKLASRTGAFGPQASNHGIE